MEWIIENKEWLFSGIGLLVLSTIGGLFYKKSKGEKNNQGIKSGDHSINIQGSSDIRIGDGRTNDEKQK